MTSIQGENLAREWEEEQRAPELWDVLQTIRTNTEAGLEGLSKLAEAGSALSMMYLGDTYLHGRFQVQEDHDLGEQWLRRSTEVGSIEGAFLLAYHLMHSGRADSAVEIYERLANLNYSPAQFVLGWHYLNGKFIAKDLERSFFYLKQADGNGHLHAGRWISHVLMSESGNPLSWVRGLVKRIVLTIPFVRMKVAYPGSDRLRT